MTIEELNAKLVEAYSDQNLNKITLTLLNFYKEEQYSGLNKIAEIISDFVNIEISDEGKGFSKLMMLYHPDRGDFHRNAIAALTLKGDYDRLLDYSHILKLIHIEEIASNIDSLEDIDYSPVYEWDVQSEGFYVVDENRKKRTHTRSKKRPKSYSFYDAFRIRIFGNTKTEVPFYYFEDMDEIELSESSIDSLDGIKLCIHAVEVELSGNQITDLAELWGLSLIEELDISGNRIENIDTLSNLTSLRHLNIADNRVADLSPLFELGKLESVILSGNPINPTQVAELIELGVNVEIE